MRFGRFIRILAGESGKQRCRVEVRADLERIRERIVIGLIALVVSLAIYAAFGLAWTIKFAIEAPQKLRHVHD